MKRILVLYFYPAQFIFCVLIPIVFCLVYPLFFDLELVAIKWILYFSFCSYFGYIGFKHQLRSLKPVDLNLLELQSIHSLLENSEIYGSSLSIHKEITIYILKQNNQYNGDEPSEEFA